ncbi:MAG: LysR family transcriptional regulator [Psychrobium sp.]
MLNQSRHIQIFCQIVEAGGISKAAEALEVSKSVISQHLKTLEQELGISLLNRTTRRQTLTPVGKEFYQQCKQINQLTKQAWQQAQAAQEVAKGIVTITAPHALMDSVVALAIGELLIEHPLIKPVLIADDQRQDLIKNNIDIAVRVGELPDSDYRQVKLGEFRDVLCASQTYIDKHFSDNAIEWSAINYIANDWQGSHVNHQLTHIHSKNKPLNLSFTPQRRANSLPTVVALAKAGAGIALLPHFIVALEPALMKVVTDYQLPPNEVFALHAYSSGKPKAVELAIGAINNKMKSLI